MGTGNPNHPVAMLMDGQWHKVAALLMLAAGLDEFDIDPAAVQRLTLADVAVWADARAGRLVIRLLDSAEAERLARREGGLPV